MSFWYGHWILAHPTFSFVLCSFNFIVHPVSAVSPPTQSRSKTLIKPRLISAGEDILHLILIEEESKHIIFHSLAEIENSHQFSVPKYMGYDG